MDAGTVRFINGDKGNGGNWVPRSTLQMQVYGEKNET